MAVKSVEAYLKSLDKPQIEIAKQVQKLVLDKYPDASEGIAYGMPSYKLSGKPLFYFALYKSHLGIYALPHTHAEFKQKLSTYKQGKGSVQFPLDQMIPYHIIEMILDFRATEIKNQA